MQVLNFLLINLKKKAFLQEVKFQVGGVYKWAYEVQKKGGERDVTSVSSFVAAELSGD